MSEPLTHVSLLTPAGRGAVATVGVSGPQATGFVAQRFQAAAGRPLESFPLGRIVFGRWGRAEGEELVVCRVSDTEVEVHCHGGKAAATEVIRSLVELGAQEINGTAWTVQHESSVIRAEALTALAEARTERTAAILLDQYRGALEAELERVGDFLTRSEYTSALTAIKELLARASVGLHLTAPWRVVIAGQPNVGKSSLLNALVGYERAIVYDHPGTTRDVLRALIACDGWPVELSDTAGLGDTSDELEQASMAHAELEIRRADLVLHVVDALAETRAAPPACERERVLTVVNKCDLLTNLPPKTADEICVSARSGLGLADLIAGIAQRLIPVPPPPAVAVPFAARQIAHLQGMLVALERGDAAAASAALRILLTDLLAR